jgi:ketosteroid isomerase-like protein
VAKFKETGIMTSIENKQLMQNIFSELSKGNGKPFLESMAEEFCWTITGTTKWSRTYRGKQAVRNELLRPLFSQFADQYTNTAQRFIAEDDYVVVECRGHVTTRTGKPYNNTYCYVCRLAGGKLQALTEYLDTELVASALEEPGSAMAVQEIAAASDEPTATMSTAEDGTLSARTD